MRKGPGSFAASSMARISSVMSSTRLPGKPMADIAGLPMIVQVALRASESGAGQVAVATDSKEVADAVEKAGFTAIMTRADHQSGSDRIFEALGSIDPEGRYESIINLQGDLPTIAPEDIRAVAGPLDDPRVDIATLGVEIVNEARNNVGFHRSMLGDIGSLISGGALTEADRQQAQERMLSATARLKEAEEELEAAKIRFGAR